MSKRTRYKVLDRIGVGGMATVHLARERQDQETERLVAIKRLLPHLAEDEEFVRSFVREAKLASHLEHPNIVELYRLGKVGHDYFICMEYIDGHDLRQIFKQAHIAAGPPPIGVALAILCELMDALAYAHSCTDQRGRPLGLIHRDISPANLLINGAGHLKIIDFGVAKATSKNTQTQTGLVKGKYAYMAPEAIHAEELDARSDVFSAGIVAHELLTARPLFASRNDYHTIQRIECGEVLPPSTYNPMCPPELDAVVLRALERDPDERWQSAADMRDALSEIRVGFRPHDSARDVCDWIDLAFALDPTKRRRRRARSGARLWTQAPMRLATGTPPGPQPVGVTHDDVVLDSDDDDADTLVFSRVSPEDLDAPEEPSSPAAGASDGVPLLSRPVIDRTGQVAVSTSATLVSSPPPMAVRAALTAKVTPLAAPKAEPTASKRAATEEFGAGVLERGARRYRTTLAVLIGAALVVAAVVAYPRAERRVGERANTTDMFGSTQQKESRKAGQRSSTEPIFTPIESRAGTSADGGDCQSLPHRHTVRSGCDSATPSTGHRDRGTRQSD
jgi:serine/threonine-protein kinase